jgi:hypothetical protein
VNLKIFLAGFEENDWKLTGSFVYNSDQYSVGHPSVDKTGTVLTLHPTARAGTENPICIFQSLPTGIGATR